MTTDHFSSTTDRYTPVARIGSGGQAEILLAVQSNPGGFEKLVVIKRLWPHLADDQRSRRRLEQEAQLVARLHHPNVCQVLNLIENETGPLVVLEYLDGITFEQVIAALPAVRTADDIRLIAGILQQTCEGLHSVHTLRSRTSAPACLVHRDVSSRNVIITRAGIVKVIDFGIAKATSNRDSRVAHIRGTVPFMSPEQVQGLELDHRSDIYSLAVLAYEALSGVSLHRRDNVAATFDSILNDSPPPIANQPAVPPALEHAVLRALAKARDNRTASARDFGTAVAEAVRGAGGSMGLAEIASVIETRFADALAQRARQFDALSLTPTLPAQQPELWTERTFLELPRLNLSAIPHSTSTITVAPAVIDLKPTPVPTQHRSQRRWIVPTALATSAMVVVAVTWSSEPVAVTLPDRARASGESKATLQDRRVLPSEHPPNVVASPSSGSAFVIVDGPKNGEADARPPARPRNSQPHASPGFLTLASNPTATIRIDGKLVGETPLYRLALPPGKHRIVATRADGRKQAQTINLRSNEDIRRPLTW